ncbi:hypothetical protein [Xylanimonas ulmi]|uniref:Uncharacterized protein n=1 Tax=Xylanimonas ulmi TaxID=228973 RepID=A0A4Q7M448_9MICO|nr:hypothetical protein [Xylanibacterium ulmi]RZS61677.1 hypothetical protein EV386_1987 [Xylanibacterium ulmi]
MRIRLSVELRISRDRDRDDAEPQRESQTDAWVADSSQEHDAPRIGFGTFNL